VLADIANYLGINFGFGFYTEAPIPNAAFVPVTLVKAFKPDLPSDGTILLGRKLLKETRRTTNNLGPALTGADWVSGLAMRRLGLSLSDTRSGIECSMGVFGPGSPTHPDSPRRLIAVTEGWEAG